MTDKPHGFDLEELRQAIRVMNNRGNHTRLYKLLKEELSARGWWKNKPRYKGNVTNFTKRT